MLMMKKRVVSIISGLLFALTLGLSSSFSVLHAENNEIQLIPDDSINAYNFFFTMGFSNIIATDIESGEDVNLDLTGTLGSAGGLDGHIGNTGHYMSCVGTPQSKDYAPWKYECRYKSNSGVDFGDYQQLSINTFALTANQSLSGTIGGGGTNINFISPKLYCTDKNKFYKPTSYDENFMSFIGANDSLIISFYSNAYTQASNVNVYEKDGKPITVQNVLYDYVTDSYGVNRKYVIRIKNNSNSSARVTIALNMNASQWVIPLFLGSERTLTDEKRQTFGIPTVTENLINQTNNLVDSGNSKSQQSESDANSKNQELTNKVNQYHNIEQGFDNNLSSNFNNINVSNGNISDSKFISSSRWVANQFTRLVVGTPFEKVLMFCLVSGLSLLVVGKVKR